MSKELQYFICEKSLMNFETLQQPPKTSFEYACDSYREHSKKLEIQENKPNLEQMEDQMALASPKPLRSKSGHSRETNTMSNRHVQRRTQFFSPVEQRPAGKIWENSKRFYNVPNYGLKSQCSGGKDVLTFSHHSLKSRYPQQVQKVMNEQLPVHEVGKNRVLSAKKPSSNFTNQLSSKLIIRDGWNIKKNEAKLDGLGKGTSTGTHSHMLSPTATMDQHTISSKKRYIKDLALRTEILSNRVGAVNLVDQRRDMNKLVGKANENNLMRHSQKSSIQHISRDIEFDKNSSILTEEDKSFSLTSDDEEGRHRGSHHKNNASFKKSETQTVGQKTNFLKLPDDNYDARPTDRKQKSPLRNQARNERHRSQKAQHSDLKEIQQLIDGSIIDKKKEHVYRKEFQTAEDNRVHTYQIIRDEETSISSNQYVYKTKVNQPSAARQLKSAIRSNKLPQDLMLEMTLREQFLKDEKDKNNPLLLGKKVMEDFILSKIDAKDLEKHKSKVDQKTVKQKYHDFQLGQMNQEVFENQQDELTKFKVDKSKVSASKMEKTEDTVRNLFERKFTRLPTHIMSQMKEAQKKNQLKELIRLQNEMIEGMSCFDESLKLKLQINVDMIGQDMNLWDYQIKKFREETKRNHPKKRVDQLMPDFVRESDQNLKQMVERLQMIIFKLHSEPFHQNVQAFNGKDVMFNPMMNRIQDEGPNLKNIYHQQAEMVEDLKEVTDCLKKLIQRQSLHWIIHQQKAPAESLLIRRQTSVFQSKRTISKQETFSSNAFHSHAQVSSNPKSDSSKTQKPKDSDLFDNFHCNQILGLASTFFYTVINKHMEMFQLQQHRQKLMVQKQNQIYREQVEKKVYILESIYQNKSNEYEKKINELQNQLKYSRDECQRLINTIQDKNLEIMQLAQKDEGMGYLKRIVHSFNLHMDEMEDMSEKIEVKQVMVKKLIQQFERAEFKSDVDNMSTKKKKNDFKSTHTVMLKHDQQEKLDQENVLKRQKTVKNKKVKGINSNKYLEVKGSGKNTIRETSDEDSSSLKTSQFSKNVYSNHPANLICPHCHRNYNSPASSSKNKHSEMSSPKFKKYTEKNSGLTMKTMKTGSKQESKQSHYSKSPVKKAREEYHDNSMDEDLFQTQPRQSTLKNLIQPSKEEQLGLNQRQSESESVSPRSKHLPMKVQSPLGSSNSKFKAKDKASKERSLDRVKVPQSSKITPKNENNIVTESSGKPAPVEPTFQPDNDDQFSNYQRKMDLTIKNPNLKLPETTIIRFIEVAMEEMIMHEIVHSLDNFLPNFKKMQLFHEHLMNFLMKQYGLPVLAHDYFCLIMQKVKEYASEVQFQYKYSKILLQTISEPDFHESDFELQIWTKEQQRVAIFAITFFQDAQTAMSQIKGNEYVSHWKKIQIQKVSQVSDIMAKGGQEISIFQLNEMMAKTKPISDLIFKMIDNLLPAKFDYIEGDKVEEAYLEFARMKVTYKLAKLNFDENHFFDELDPGKTNWIELDQLFTLFADKYLIYFSMEEQLAIRNLIFPDCQDESTEMSKKRKVQIRTKTETDTGCFDNLILLNEDDYLEKLGNYMVTKCDFVHFVQEQWLQYMTELSQKLNNCFQTLDSFLKRKGINQPQLFYLVEKELGFNFEESFGQPISDEFFETILQLENRKCNREEKLLSLETVRSLVIEKNREVYPFAKYFYLRNNLKGHKHFQYIQHQ